MSFCLFCLCGCLRGCLRSTVCWWDSNFTVNQQAWAQHKSDTSVYCCSVRLCVQNPTFLFVGACASRKRRLKGRSRRRASSQRKSTLSPVTTTAIRTLCSARISAQLQSPPFPPSSSLRSACVLSSERFHWNMCLDATPNPTSRIVDQASRIVLLVPRPTEAEQSIATVSRRNKE